MTRLEIPSKAVDVIQALDQLIENPFVRLPNQTTNRKLGYYAKQLRKNGGLGIYWDDSLRETIGILKTKKVKKIDGIGRNIEYLFDDFKIKMPEIEL